MNRRTRKNEPTASTTASRPGREFKRGFFGYRRKEVDARLAEIDALIADLQVSIEATASVEHHDLVLRATRRSIEEMMERAERDAAAVREGAEAVAAKLLADAYELARARDGAVIDLRPDDAGHEGDTATASVESALFAPEPVDDA